MILSREVLNSILNDNYMAIDIETDGLDPNKNKIISLSITYPGGVTEYFEGADKTLLSMVLETSRFTKVFHNANFDLKFLEKKFKIAGSIIDTLLLAQLIDENQSLKLKDLAVKYLGDSSIDNARALYSWLEKNKLSKSDIHKAPAELLKAYNNEDALNTYNLAKVLVKQIFDREAKIKSKFARKITLVDYFLEEAMPLESVLRKMEQGGVLIDFQKLNSIKSELEKEKQEIIECLSDNYNLEIQCVLDKKKQELQEKRKTDKGKNNVKTPDFNWNSNDQIGELFFDHLLISRNYYKVEDLKFAKTDTGKWKCCEFVFNKIMQDHKNKDIITFFCSNYLKYLKLKKQLGTDIEGLIERSTNNRIFPSYKQIGVYSNEASGTVTGRLSSANPNMQNIPPFARKFYIPDTPSSIFVYFDYSQIELRLAAQLSKDEVMLDLFSNNGDLHTLTAQAIFKKKDVTKQERQVAKTSNFLFIYNGSPYRFRDQLEQESGIKISLDEAKAFRDNFFRQYKKYGEFLQSQKEFMIENRVVISPFGRVRRLPDLKFYAGLNYQRATYDGTARQELDSAIAQLKEKDKYKINSYGKKILKTPFDIASRKVSHAFNQGYNFPVQSMAASLMKRSMIAIDELGYTIKNQVHDSIIIQTNRNHVDKTIKDCQEVLENIVQLSIPLIAEPKVLNSFCEDDVYARAENDDSGPVPEWQECSEDYQNRASVS